jgi:hypothetical protein
MEGKRKTRARRLKRCYQCSRLEDQLWAMAYEQVWPLVRRALTEGQPAENPRAR